ncbi:MAG: VanZ family protein [Candidatus Baldrarchaeia archaeon]
MINKLKLVTIFYVIVLTILAVIPTQTVSGAPSFSDKFEHFLAFLVLGVLSLYSFKNKAFLIVYPVFHEGLQLFVSWRVFDFNDLFSNFMGVICAFIALYFVNKNKKRDRNF